MELVKGDGGVGQVLGALRLLMPFPTAEGNIDGRVIASARPTRRGRRPWHVKKLLVLEPSVFTHLTSESINGSIQ
jgi:hypothetical protein